MENFVVAAVAFSIVYAVLTVAGNWLLFRKAGKPGWHSLIPILNEFDVYRICWKGRMFLLNAILIMVAAACAPSKTGIDSTALTIVSLAALLGIFIIRWNLSMKLARSFGKGFFFGLFLFLFSKFGRASSASAVHSMSERMVISPSTAILPQCRHSKESAEHPLISSQKPVPGVFPETPL